MDTRYIIWDSPKTGGRFGLERFLESRKLWQISGEVISLPAERFSKVLSPYYIKWFQDCHDSVLYCRERDDEAKAQEYLRAASVYLTIIMENWEEIEFFSIGENAFKVDRVLPERFRG